MATPQDALARARTKQDKQAKERAAREERINKMTSPVKTNGDQKPVAEPTPVPAPEAKAGDQNDTPEAKSKKSREDNPTVVAWKATSNFSVEAKIALVSKENKKKRNAGVRFGFYRDGMTVQQYIDVMKEKGRTPAQTHGDIRWDSVKGFIVVK